MQRMKEKQGSRNCGKYKKRGYLRIEVESNK
jgi:hypothetical protein